MLLWRIVPPSGPIALCRYPGSQIRLLALPSRSARPISGLSGRSSLVTVAGQRRIRTDFPDTLLLERVVWRPRGSIIGACEGQVNSGNFSDAGSNAPPCRSSVYSVVSIGPS